MVDVNKPVTNPDLLAAIKRMQENNTAETRIDMINEVMKAHFLTPVTIDLISSPDNEDGSMTLKENTHINFHIIENTENQNFFLAFTDWNELKKWNDKADQQTVIMTFDDYASMILDEAANSSGFVINLYGENVAFSKNLVASLKKKKN